VSEERERSDPQRSHPNKHSRLQPSNQIKRNWISVRNLGLFVQDLLRTLTDSGFYVCLVDFWSLRAGTTLPDSVGLST